ncbi:cobalamin-dependent protein [Candidatus Woesearchaeota archaeon]|nr:cobalamin-dependent protein [Candidatus Woesearchaeota archaeon]
MKILLIGFNIQEDVYPLTLSYLKGYANKFHEDVDIKIKEFSVGNRIDNTVNKTIELQVLSYILLENPLAVGFSCYIWNINLIKRISRLLKQTNPDIKIFFGGVEVNESSLTENVDYIMIGEGEIALKELIDYFKQERSLDEVSNITYKNKNKLITTQTKIIENLDDIPNPYAISKKKNYTTIRIETTRGCPYDCKYCHYATKKPRYFSINYLKNNLDYIFNNLEFSYLTIIDANININKQRMKQVLDLIGTRKIKVAFELKPELIDEETIQILQSYEFTINAELGLQSTDKDVLTNCKRTFDLSKVAKGLDLLSNSKIKFKIDLMYGLPEDNFFKFLNSTRFLLKYAKYQNQLPAHHFMLLNNTEFEKELDNRMDKNNSSMILQTSTQNPIDLFKTKLFVEQLNEELKLLR